MADENANQQTLAKIRQGLALHQQGQLEQARKIYSQVVEHQPQNAKALYLLGVIAAQSGDLNEAIDHFGQSLAIDPSNATAWFNYGNALSQLRLFMEAIQSYDKAIVISPMFFAAHNSLGNALKNDLQPFAAVDSYRRAIAIQPAYAEAHINLGIVYVELNQYRNALASFDKVLTLRPGDIAVLQQQKSAIDKFRQHQAVIGNYYSGPYKKPGQALVYCQRGDALIKQNEYYAALARYDEALAIEPELAEAYFGRGNALSILKLDKAAVDSYDKATFYKPGLAMAHLNCATALSNLRQYDAAINSFNRAVHVKELAADAYAGRAVAQMELANYLEAFASYDLALASNPDLAHYAFGQRMHARMRICHWHTHEQQIEEMIRRIQLDQKVCMPFAALAAFDSAKLLLQTAQIYSKDAFPANPSLGIIPKKASNKRIRIAYFSMDFKNHPVSYLTAELFEIHDRTRFEVMAFAYGPNPQDAMRKRLEIAFDKFIDANGMTDLEVAKLARAMQIDIAIDLAGFTGICRTGIFACRAAPIQVNYLGYPGTMGASFMDYIIADQQLIPPELRVHYAEKIAYLPVFQINDRKRKISDKVFARRELGLPDIGFIFCCFNKSYKITPATFDGWMRILLRVKDSVLFLLSTNTWTSENLKKEALARGIDPQRLVFGSAMPTEEYLARYRVADLFLDTFPFNAGTTASDALWTGLPVLTRRGESFASRMASSLLIAIGLPELIAADQVAYENLAVELATNPVQMNAARSKLQRHKHTYPLFDSESFARHLENVYTQMVTRYQADQPPDDIYMEPISADRV